MPSLCTLVHLERSVPTTRDKFDDKKRSSSETESSLEIREAGIEYVLCDDGILH